VHADLDFHDFIYREHADNACGMMPRLLFRQDDGVGPTA
jgi:hypothetical protein